MRLLSAQPMWMVEEKARTAMWMLLADAVVAVLEDPPMPIQHFGPRGFVVPAEEQA